jgi:hypothetical protein
MTSPYEKEPKAADQQDFRLFYEVGGTGLEPVTPSLSSVPRAKPVVVTDRDLPANQDVGRCYGLFRSPLFAAASFHRLSNRAARRRPADYSRRRLSRS